MPKWIKREHIRKIPGALKPGAYVARAYKHARKDPEGRPPQWARKSGQEWLFLRSEIEADAKRNRRFMTPSEVARDIGVSRRTVLNWADAGHLGEIVKVGKSNERRIAREEYDARKDVLRKRLERPDAMASRMRAGKGLPQRTKERASRKAGEDKDKGGRATQGSKAKRPREPRQEVGKQKAPERPLSKSDVVRQTVEEMKGMGNRADIKEAKIELGQRLLEEGRDIGEITEILGRVNSILGRLRDI
jgi:excisionase family DNA binding protein